MTQSLLAFDDGLPVGSQVSLTTNDRGVITGQAVANPGSGASSPLTPVPSSLQGTIIVDPQNATGVASSQGNTIATVDGFTGRVFDLWSSLCAAWGTTQPFFNANTTIVYASSSPASSDPIIFEPRAAAALNVTIRAPLQPAGVAIVLAGVVAKNRAAGANALLQADIGQNLPAGTTMLVNATRGNSVAWINALVAGTTYSLSQPFAPVALGGVNTPAEVDTWANGDSVAAFSMLTITPLLVRPAFNQQGASSFQLAVNLYHVLATNASANGPVMMLGSVNVLEARLDKTVLPLQFNVSQWNCINSFCQGITQGNGPMTFVGGIVGTSGITYVSGSTFRLDGDVIINGAVNVGAGICGFGLVYLAANIVLNSGLTRFQNIFYGAHVVYGNATATIQLTGGAVGVMSTGTYAAGWTAAALVTPGVQLNGTSTASSQDNGNPVTVISGNIGTTVAALDAAQGVAGFGGVAFKLGGASVRNVA